VKKSYGKILALLGIALLLFFGGWKIRDLKDEGVTEVKKEDKYVAFLTEVYEKIQDNYWEKMNDEDLAKIYQLAVEKIVGQAQSLKTNDKEGVKKMIEGILKDVTDDKKKEFCAGVADVVLANLQPFGRSRLYARKEAVDLSNNVNNINPEADYYKSLGIGKEANSKQVEEAYTKVEKELEPLAKESTEAAEKLAEAKSAYEVLKDSENREIYKDSGVEPTIKSKLINPKVFWVHLTKFSPTSLEEFARVMQKADTGEQLDGLIFDLRDNIGGAIDNLPYFLGPFIGPDQYAYQFYHQGEKEDFKTRSGWINSLGRYKKVVILINEQSQSSAELMASVLKKYNVGVLMGTTSKGWGTIEKVFPIENQIDDKETYSIFLVHRITLREDGQPIEGNGVEPVISFDDKNWKAELLKYFEDPSMVGAVEAVK